MPQQRTRRILEGGIYKARSPSECTSPVLPTNLTPKARSHMLLVIGKARGRPCCWRVMTITKAANDLLYNGINTDKYIPFAPVPKKPYAIQLQLAPDVPGAHYATFPFESYLRIDEEYWVHADALVECEQGNGYHFQVKQKKMGGMGELRSFLLKREGAAERAVSAGEPIVSSVVAKYLLHGGTDAVIESETDVHAAKELDVVVAQRNAVRCADGPGNDVE